MFSFTSVTLFSEVGTPQSGKVSHWFQKLEHHSLGKCHNVFRSWNTTVRGKNVLQHNDAKLEHRRMKKINK